MGKYNRCENCVEQIDGCKNSCQYLPKRGPFCVIGTALLGIIGCVGLFIAIIRCLISLYEPTF